MVHSNGEKRAHIDIVFTGISHVPCSSSGVDVMHRFVTSTVIRGLCALSLLILYKDWRLDLTLACTQTNDQLGASMEFEFLDAGHCTRSILFKNMHHFVKE